MVGDIAFSHKIDYVTIFKEIQNIEGHPNCITGSKVSAILLNVWILPIGVSSAVKGLRLQPAQQACSYRLNVLQVKQSTKQIFSHPTQKPTLFNIT